MTAGTGSKLSADLLGTGGEFVERRASALLMREADLIDRITERAERIAPSGSHSNVARALARDVLVLIERLGVRS